MPLIEIVLLNDAPRLTHLNGGGRLALNAGETIFDLRLALAGNLHTR